MTPAQIHLPENRLLRSAGKGEAMKRLPGVIFSAIILLLGSLFQLLMAALMGFGGAVEQSQIRSGLHPGAPAAAPVPEWLPAFTYGLCAVFVALALWGILTAVGLFRMRRWARYSILVIGGCLALIGLPSMLMMLVMLAVPLPLPASVDASQAHTAQAMTKVVFGVIALIYGVICAVGVSWLVYFNRRKVREAFAHVTGQVVESRRPLLISVVAVLSMIGGPSCLLMAFLPLPAAFLGLILHGWEKAAIYLVYGALLAAAGVGLWRLEEWGRRLAMAMQLIGLAQFVVYIVRPSLLTNYSAEIDRTMNVTQPQMPAQFQNMIYGVSFGFGILLLIAIVAILHHYRGAFGQSIGPSRTESPALP